MGAFLYSLVPPFNILCLSAPQNQGEPMTTILAATIGFGVITTIMAVGVILGRSPLKGSCGGKGGPECVCDAFEQKKCEARKRMLEARLQKLTR